MWDASGGAGSTLHTRVRTASAALAPLAGLVAEEAIPLPPALVVNESKVDGVLANGRWLYATSTEMLDLLESTQAQWALTFLSFSRFRSLYRSL